MTIIDQLKELCTPTPATFRVYLEHMNTPTITRRVVKSWTPDDAGRMAHQSMTDPGEWFVADIVEDV